MTIEVPASRWGLALIMSALCASGCMVTHKSGVALSGYRAEMPRYQIFESGDQLYVMFTGRSTTWIPTVEYSNALDAAARISLAEIFGQVKEKRFYHCRYRDLPPAAELKVIPEGGSTSRMKVSNGSGYYEYSKCYELQIEDERITIYDNCKDPHRKGDFSRKDLDKSTPLWAYPVKLVAHPVAFAVDVVYVPTYALLLFFGLGNSGMH